MDGKALSDDDFNSYFLLLVVAGNETTRHTITHSMNYLMDNPDQMALLQEKPELIPWAVEEFLRMASPVYHFRRTATKDTETFSSERGTVNLEELDEDQIEARKSMLETDGVRHRALRRLMQGEFTPKAVSGYEIFLRGLTASTLDAAFANKEFELVDQVAADFPIRVLAKMLDVPDTDIYKLIDWGNRMIGNDDPEHADVLASSAESEEFRLLPFRSPAAREVFEYGNDLANQRRGKDGTDLVSRLVNQTPMDGAE